MLADGLLIGGVRLKGETGRLDETLHEGMILCQQPDVVREAWSRGKKLRMGALRSFGERDVQRERCRRTYECACKLVETIGLRGSDRLPERCCRLLERLESFAGFRLKVPYLHVDPFLATHTTPGKRVPFQGRSCRDSVGSLEGPKRGDRVFIDGGPLRPEDVVAVALRHEQVEMAPSVYERMAPARRLIEQVIEEGRTVYGVTTGFGALANTPIGRQETGELQVHLLRSHAAGVGDPLPDEVVRAMLLLRARTLSQGHSGVRPVLVERYVEFLNRNLLPVVPSQGSVGASGDLAPFAHLALPLIGEGLLSVEGRVRPASEVLAENSLEPIHLEPKEGLSLLNGTEGMLAQGVLSLARSERLVDTADLACALSVEGLLGSARPFRPEIHALRPHPGQIASAGRIAALLDGSEIVASHRDDFTHAVQDAYSLRCAPQVHGAVADALTYAREVFVRELGSVVDNPIVLPETGEIVSGGNFHGQPLAIALDVMALAITELSSISERRTDRLLDPERSSGLPAFLAVRPGVDSGYMLAQYTAAALVAENRVLSHPASVESIPTSGSQEDHVSMGWGAARKLTQVLDNVTLVLAVELICAARGVDLRGPLKPSPAVAGAIGKIRAVVPPMSGDRPPGIEIEAVAELIQTGTLLS